MDNRFVSEMNRRTFLCQAVGTTALAVGAKVLNPRVGFAQVATPADGLAGREIRWA